MKARVKFLGSFHNLSSEVRRELLRSTLRDGMMRDHSSLSNSDVKVRVWAAHVAGKLAGWAILADAGDSSVRWFQVFTKCSCRRQGIASSSPRSTDDRKREKQPSWPGRDSAANKEKPPAPAGGSSLSTLTIAYGLTCLSVLSLCLSAACP